MEAERTPLHRYQFELLGRRECKRARAELVDSMSGAIRKHAARFARLSKMDREDLETEAKVAVLMAIDSFDISVGVVFSTYCWDRIIWHLMGVTKGQASVIRVPVEAWDKGKRGPIVISANEKVNHSEDSDQEIIDTLRSHEPSPLEMALRADDARLTHKALARLRERERTILIKRADGLTLEEVGELFGLTRERIRQLEEIALPKFAAALREVLKPSPKARNLAVKMVKPSGQLTPEEARRSRQAEAAEMKAAKIVHYGSRDVSPRCGLVLPRNAKMVLDMAQVSCRICVRLGPLQRPKPDAKAAPRVESWVAVAFGPSR